MAKHPGGRPTKYNEKFHPLLVEALCKLGHTEEEIAEKLNINKNTMLNWKRKHKEFLGALKRGKEGIDDQVENALLKRALGFERNDAVKMFQFNGTVIKENYTEYYPPDVAAAFIWLKNRRPEKWRDKHNVEIEGSTLGEMIAAAFENRKNDKSSNSGT